MSRGMPSRVVTSLQFAIGPILFIFFVPDVNFPWNESWWQVYLIFSFILTPLALCALTYAVHITPVTAVQPLSAISCFSTLMIGSLILGESFSSYGVVGVLIITCGLLILYHGRWDMWRKSGPWIALVASLVLGANLAIAKFVLFRFPHIFAVMALVLTAFFVMNAIFAGRSWKSLKLTKFNVLILCGMMIAVAVDNFGIFSALALGPSAYVVAIKRSSILLTAFIGYVFLKERDQSLSRLLVASGIVVVGVVMLTI